MVSIGGANNNPLAKVCKNVEELKTQYKNIIDNLNLSVLDFDIEGGHVADSAAIKRRSQALKMLQEELALEGRAIPIWITLPVLPTGLTADGVNVIRSAMSHGVKLAGINLMTMDYGGSMGCQSINRQHEKTGVSNSKCDIDATKSVHGQIRQLADEFSLKLSDSDIWSMLGATPMLGVNDQDLEVFFLYDAQNLRSHAENKGLGMLSMWSVARDRSAPSGQAWQVSPSHSGLTANKAASRAYSREFAQFDTENPSTPPAPAPTPTPTPTPTPKPPKPTPVDPPSGISLYKAGTTYKEGDKVAHNGHIYQCKPWPFTGWCSSTHEAYTPGTGGAWSNAWTKID
jgi:bifunctional chitinase/lysozyme